MLESAYETVVSFLLYHKQIAKNVWYLKKKMGSVISFTLSENCSLLNR